MKLSRPARPLLAPVAAVIRRPRKPRPPEKSPAPNAACHVIRDKGSGGGHALIGSLGKRLAAECANRGWRGTRIAFASILAAAGVATLTAQRQDWAPNITTAATWQSNATNANRGADILDALQLRSELAAGRRFTPGGSDTLRLGGQITAEAWPRYDGLDQLAVGPRVGWTHKFGLGPLAPTLSVDFAGDAVAARESGRGGWTGFATVTLQKRLDPSWQLALAHERARHDARQTAFDRTGEETSVRADYDWDSRWRFSLCGRHRHGGVLSYATPPRPDLLAAGRVLGSVTTFDRARPMNAYFLLARTLAGEAAVSLALDDATALHFAYEHRETEKGAIRYVNHLVTAGVTRQF